MTNIFTPELIQAVNDWQRGGSHAQKVRRGQSLKECATALPAAFRSCNESCFRQEAHEKDLVWQLLADNHLPETIAAWTTDFDVAKYIKGGVPPAGLQGVIFRIVPPPQSIVFNLTALYADPDFRAATRTYASNTDGFSDGIGRYGDSQCEVVLDIGNLDQASVVSYGGLSSDKETLIEQQLQRKPTPEDFEEFERRSAKANVTPGDWWLSQDGTQAVMNRMQPRIEELKKKKARELAAKA